MIRTMPQWLYDDMLILSHMTDDQVKALWDEYDGDNSPGGVSGESIHCVLNERGFGAYCAV